MERLKSRIFFVEKSIQESFDELKEGKTEEQELYRHLSNAFENLKENAYAGIQIPKRLIPQIYITKYKVTNLWKYDLPKGWRLIYSVGQEGITILSIILEWLDHKEYERRFGY